jgi:hypothetical protein
MSENSPEDWRQVSKGRRAVTQTDERRVTLVRNQFQELSEHQEDSTPRLAPRELIAAFSRLPPEDNNNTETGFDDNAETGSIGRTDTQEDPTPRLALRELIAAFPRLPPEDDNTDSNDSDNRNPNPNPNDDNTETGTIGSFDTMTDITNNYGCLIEIIRLVNAEQATVYSGKKKNYADILKFREALGSALATQPCSTYSVEKGPSYQPLHWKNQMDCIH